MPCSLLDASASRSRPSAWCSRRAPWRRCGDHPPGGAARPSASAVSALDPEAEARSWLKPDPEVRRAQAAATDLIALPTPAPNPASLIPASDAAGAAGIGGQSLSLQAALYGR